MIIVVLSWLGLCMGSFVNALVFRLYKQSEQSPVASRQSAVKARKPATSDRRQANEFSVLSGRSQCVHCGRQLAAADLIPVVSWLWLKGKCRYCRKPISWQYPLVELLTALLFVVSYIFWPYGFDMAGVVRFATWLVMLTGFVALVVYDLRWMLLPNRIVYPLLGLAAGQVLVLASLSGGSWFTIISGAVWGLLFAGGTFYVLFQLSQGKWIGGGDVKLGFVLGLILGGPIKSLLMLFAASALGLLVTVPLLLGGRATRHSRIPFGPFLIVAAIITYLFGGHIINWYDSYLLTAPV